AAWSSRRTRPPVNTTNIEPPALRRFRLSPRTGVPNREHCAVSLRRRADGPRKIAPSTILGWIMKRSVLVLAALASLALLLSLTLGAATARAQFARGLGTVQGTV